MKWTLTLCLRFNNVGKTKLKHSINTNHNLISLASFLQIKHIVDCLTTIFYRLLNFVLLLH